MAGGWTRDGAMAPMQDQIDDTVSDVVRLARAGMTNGEGETYCRACGDEIPSSDDVHCTRQQPA